MDTVTRMGTFKKRGYNSSESYRKILLGGDRNRLRRILDSINIIVYSVSVYPIAYKKQT